MRYPVARRAELSGHETSDIRSVLSAAAKLALFQQKSIELSRDQVADLIDELAHFLAEVNDASPKL